MRRRKLHNYSKVQMIVVWEGAFKCKQSTQYIQTVLRCCIQLFQLHLLIYVRRYETTTIQNYLRIIAATDFEQLVTGFIFCNNPRSIYLSTSSPDTWCCFTLISLALNQNTARCNWWPCKIEERVIFTPPVLDQEEGDWGGALTYKYMYKLMQLVYTGLLSIRERPYLPVARVKFRANTARSISNKLQPKL